MARTHHALKVSLYEVARTQQLKYIEPKVERVGVLNFCLHAVARFHHSSFGHSYGPRGPKGRAWVLT